MLADAAPAALNSLPRFSVGMLADLLWSYAAVGVKDDALLSAAAQVSIKTRHRCLHFRSKNGSCWGATLVLGAAHASVGHAPSKLLGAYRFSFLLAQLTDGRKVHSNASFR